MKTKIMYEATKEDSVMSNRDCARLNITRKLSCGEIFSQYFMYFMFFVC